MTTPLFCHFPSARRTVNLGGITCIDHNAPTANGKPGTRVFLADGNSITLITEDDIAILADACAQFPIRTNAAKRSA